MSSNGSTYSLNQRYTYCSEDGDSMARSSVFVERPLSADAEQLLMDQHANDRVMSAHNVSDSFHRPGLGVARAMSHVGVDGSVGGGSLDPQRRPVGIKSVVEPPSQATISRLFDVINKLMIPYVSLSPPVAVFSFLPAACRYGCFVGVWYLKTENLAKCIYCALYFDR